MIKFFRNIRKKLATENRAMAYSRYAIGEIILVVIGILIALQINNWNESRKLKKIELNYLQRLVIDLNDNEKLLSDKNLAFVTERQSYCDGPRDAVTKK